MGITWKANIGPIKRFWKGIILLAFLGTRLWGLNPNIPLHRCLLDQWDISNGILSNTILSLAQTPDGFLWIASAKGLVRFDGLKFSNFDFAKTTGKAGSKTPIPDMLFVDREGTLWIGSSEGLTSFRSQTGELKTYTPAQGIAKDRIRCLKDDMHGNLWISLWTGNVNRFSNGKFSVFPAGQGLADKKVNAIIEDRKGNLLFGTREHGVFIFREEKFLPYPIPGLGNSTLITMYEDDKGELWIGTTNGLFRVTGAGTRVYTTGEGLSSNYITGILGDSDGNLWVGTLKGIHRIKKNPGGDLRVEGLLSPIIIVCFWEDREKSVWVGTYDSGLKRLKEGKFTSYAPLDAFPEENFLSAGEDRSGDTWFGTLSGKLFRCRGNDLLEIIKPPAVAGVGITAISGDTDGYLWLGTNGRGIFQKKDQTFIPYTTREGLINNQVNSISRDSKNQLWLSTFDGVSVIRFQPPGGRGKPVIESFTSREGLLGKMVYNIYEDKAQNLWIAADKGVTVLRGGETAGETLSYYLKDIPVTCIYEDNSIPGEGTGRGKVYWFATNGAGLKRLQVGKEDRIDSFTTTEGMTSNFLYQFFEDPEENFWFMSDSGVLRVGKKELNRLSEGSVNRIHCTSFGISDGLKSLEFNNELSRHSALTGRSGDFRFMTRQGISIVNPGKIQANKIPPPVVIEAIVFNRKPLPLSREMNALKGIKEARFLFTAPTFLSPGKISFQYKLEGVDKEWVFLPPGRERAAEYKKLGPGTYTFRVTACNSEGVWNRTGVSVPFTIKPFFYETLIFKIALVLLFLGLAAPGIYFYKKRLLRKQEKYKSSTLVPQFAEECIKKLNRLMEVDKLYCDPDLSLQVLAEKLSITTHQLSQILNEKLNRTFSDFINFYRIEEAKQVLKSPHGAGQKVIAVAFDVGFNTKVAFYNAFKKYTGMTPSQYRKENDPKS